MGNPFQRDLVARYGEGSGTRLEDLKVALKMRRRFYGVLTVLGLGVLYGLWVIGAWDIYLWIGLFLVGGLIIWGLIVGVTWIIDEWPTYANRIHNAKAYGVKEEK